MQGLGWRVRNKDKVSVGFQRTAVYTFRHRGCILGQLIAYRGAAGMAQQLVGRPFHHNFALNHDGQPVCQVLGLVHVMGGQHNGLAKVLQVANHLPRVPASRGIKAGGGFVQEEQVRVSGEANGDVEPTLLPTGKFLDAGLALGTQTRGVKHVLQRHGVGIVAAKEVYSLLHVQIRLHARGLKDYADSLPEFPLLTRRIISQDLHFPSALIEVPLQNLDSGGLAGAVRP